MGTGSYGTYILTWAQTQICGKDNPRRIDLVAGVDWSWTGAPVLLNQALTGATDTIPKAKRSQVARHVRGLVGKALNTREHLGAHDTGQVFVLSDGASSYTATLVETEPGRDPIILFVGELPAPARKLWVVHAAPQPDPASAQHQNVICFTPGTRIATPGGDRRVETLTEGDLVLTRDSGPRPVVWIGQRRISGARLHVMPEFRPIRFRAGALGAQSPDGPLCVSPGHRMLVKGYAVQALFNTPEVLVEARDLVNDETVRTETNLSEVTYIHLMFEDHQVLWANGVECESYRPSEAGLLSLKEADRTRLLSSLPDLSRFEHSARRCLNPSEARYLKNDVA